MTVSPNAMGALAAADAVQSAELNRPPAAYGFAPTLPGLENPVQSLAAIAFQTVCVQTLMPQMELGRRGVTVCGASLGVGVTFTATNLALALAQCGVPTLLIDANLHEAGVEGLITPPPGRPGLQDLLRSEEVALADAIHDDVVANLSILYSGGVAADASELLGAASLEAILGTCLRNYRYTIIDTAPANRTADARRVGSVVGYGLIVARRNLSYVDDVTTLAQQLAADRVEVIGSVMNAA